MCRDLVDTGVIAAAAPRRLLSLLIGLVAVLAACGGGGQAADPVAAGQRQFNIYCVGCHALAADGPTALGPTVPQMLARAAASGEDEAAWLRRAIVDPNAEVAPDYQPGLMPATYGETLRPDQIDALAAYLLSEGGGP